MRRFGFLLLLLFPVAESRALVPADRVVSLWTELQTNPPAITLKWSPGGYPLSYLIQRKPLMTTGWSTLAALTNPAAASYTDSNVTTGVGYEYKVTRVDTITNAWGFLYAGIDLPPVQSRGTLILAVESNAATLLSRELSRYELDLAGDGWTTVRLTAPWKNWSDSDWAAAVTNLKAQIMNLYNADPAHVKGVLLFGHVPVPYSGDGWPDAHENHRGAWPADSFYGDMSGPWSDTNTTANNGPRLYNVPGDGKFDPTDFGSYSVNLMVGRVDLSAMPAFAQPEIELLRQYLAKAHHYRRGWTNWPKRGLVNDNLGFFAVSGEAFAQNGIRDFGTFYGPANVFSGGWFPSLRTNRFQSVYGCGYGDYTVATGVGSTSDFTTGAVHAIFTMLFGSRFGDWDTTNCLLRAPLASVPSALTCVWAGRPKWFSHPMDLGEPIGTVFLLLQNSRYWDYETELPEDLPLGGVHTALMGDPTLRLRYPDPPRSLSATATVSQVVLDWSPAVDSNVVGYLVSRADTGGFSFSNLHDGFVTALVFTDTTARATGVLYRIRSVKKEIVRSGSYTNLSQGVYLRVDANGHVNLPPVAPDMAIATILNRPVGVPLTGQDPDGDAVFTSLVEWPAAGSLTGTPAQLVYTPPLGYTGTVRFAYEASDIVADSGTGVVTITVAPTQTSRGTSCDWLIRAIGYTNDYEHAEEEDPDHDGQPTWAEYRAGTDPLNPASVFAILSLQVTGSSNRLTWHATTNSGVYSPFSVTRGGSLTNRPWPVTASNLVRAPSGTNIWWDTNRPSRAFYRILIP